MKKSSLYVTIILVFFSIIISFLIIYTAVCNNKAMFTGLNVHDHKTIILDAGHGGIDGGTVGCDGTFEKDLNLQITIKLKYFLELYGFNVILIRDCDKSIHDDSAKTIRQQKVSDIHNREQIIIKNPNSIFVSIHQNSFPDSNVYGTQVFYSGNNALSSVLAQSITDSIVQHIQPDNKRLIKKSGTEIYLLYHSNIPSVMVECGFMSNQKDLTKLKSDKYQIELAITIADGIINYYKGL